MMTKEIKADSARALETQVFRALADPSRRRILDRLVVGDASVSELAAGFATSRPAVSQHLAALRAAGLVRERKDGRFVHYEVDPDGIGFLGAWLQKYRAYWPARMDDLNALLKDMDQ